MASSGTLSDGTAQGPAPAALKNAQAMRRVSALQIISTMIAPTTAPMKPAPSPA